MRAKLMGFAVIAVIVLCVGKVYAASYVCPLPAGSYCPASEFGERINPVTGEVEMHEGIDLGAKEGTDVYASTSGTASTYYGSATAGNYIVVTDSSGNYTRYLHLSEILIDDGDNITQGQVIGAVGNTGRSTGPHLHFEICIGGQKVDPRLYVSFVGSTSIPTPNYPVGSISGGEHKTGILTAYISGYMPLRIYRSTDYQHWDFMASVTGNKYTEYGLANGTTYYYKMIDAYGRESEVYRYTPPYTDVSILPLGVVELEDDYCHLRWSQYNVGVTLYCNDSPVYGVTTANEYTITGLKPDTDYKVYYINRYNERSNTILFKTPNKMGKLEAMLERLFKPVGRVDSNGDGVPDEMQKINDTVKDLQNKLGGSLLDDVKGELGKIGPLPEGDQATATIPKVQVNYMGINIKVFDMSDPTYKPWMDLIRALVLAILTAGFAYAIIQLFNVQFKV